MISPLISPPATNVCSAWPLGLCIKGASCGFWSCFTFSFLSGCSAWSVDSAWPVPCILHVKTCTEIFPIGKLTYLATAPGIVGDCLAFWVFPVLATASASGLLPSCSAWPFLSATPSCSDQKLRKSSKDLVQAHGHRAIRDGVTAWEHSSPLIYRPPK